MNTLEALEYVSSNIKLIERLLAQMWKAASNFKAVNKMKTLDNLKELYPELENRIGACLYILQPIEEAKTIAAGFDLALQKMQELESALELARKAQSGKEIINAGLRMKAILKQIPKAIDKDKLEALYHLEMEKASGPEKEKLELSMKAEIQEKFGFLTTFIGEMMATLSRDFQQFRRPLHSPFSAEPVSSNMQQFSQKLERYKLELDKLDGWMAKKQLYMLDTGTKRSPRFITEKRAALIKHLRDVQVLIRRVGVTNDRNYKNFRENASVVLEEGLRLIKS